MNDGLNASMIFENPAAERATAKRYLEGTHRTRTPEVTLASVQSLLPEIGITRVANLTGLDRIGVPVAMAVRPNARSVSISQGKGLTLAAAKASAVMESLEVWHAERITNPLKLASAREMRNEHEIVDVRLLPSAAGSPYHDDLPLLWIAAKNLMSGGAVWVPLELVSTNYTVPLPPGSGCFQANTNGLASGNHVLEAISHGLCEVVERDARTLWQHWLRPSQKRVLDLETIDDAACRDVLGRITGAGLQVHVWDITSDVGVASYACVLAGADADDVDAELGSGCHPVRSIALLRALTEACQARLIYIAAARDEYFPHMYSAVARERRCTMLRRLVSTPSPQHAFQHAPSFESSSLEGDLEWMLARLRSVGLPQVLAVDLTRPALRVPVVRVLVPGLEGAWDETYTSGLRARRFARGAS